MSVAARPHSLDVEWPAALSASDSQQLPVTLFVHMPAGDTMSFSSGSGSAAFVVCRCRVTLGVSSGSAALGVDSGSAAFGVNNLHHDQLGKLLSRCQWVLRLCRIRLMQRLRRFRFSSFPDDFDNRTIRQAVCIVSCGFAAFGANYGYVGVDARACCTAAFYSRDVTSANVTSTSALGRNL